MGKVELSCRKYLLKSKLVRKLRFLYVEPYFLLDLHFIIRDVLLWKSL